MHCFELKRPDNLVMDAKQTQQEEHENLKRVILSVNETKNRIYEYIAKNQRNSNKKGCVILLHGGPGTGNKILKYR